MQEYKKEYKKEYMRRRTIQAIAVLLVCVFCMAAYADVIHLRNGRKLEGKILRETEREIEVEVEFGTLTVRRRDIEKIERGPVAKRPKRKREEDPEPEKYEKPTPRQKIVSSIELEKFLALPEEKIDVGYGALLVAKGVYPTLRIEKYIDIIDRMTVELMQRLKGLDEPLKIIKEMNSYLLAQKGYVYDKDRHFLNEVLESGKGNCVSLSVLYLAIGQRLELPFYGVSAPGHMFVRYDDGKTKINIESTLKGRLLSDEMHYIKTFNISDVAIEKKYYLRNLTNKETLAAIIVNRSTVYAQKGDYRSAVRDSDKAIALDPKFVGAYFNRGLAYKFLGELDKAVEDFDKVIGFDPKFVKAYTCRGLVFTEQGEYERALRDFDMAVSLEPENPLYYHNRAVVHFRRKDMDKAIAECDKAIKLDPECHHAYFTRGNARQEKGEVDKAITDYDRAISLNPKYMHAYVNRGMAHRDKQSYVAAKGDLDRALALDPEHAYAYMLRATIHCAMKQRALMLGDIKKAVKLDPKLKEIIRKGREFTDWARDEAFDKLLK